MDMNKARNHVAIMMDGNGRWATEKGKPRSAGHYAGMLAVRRTVEAAVQLGISNLTLYAFSSENWKRPKQEVDYIMQLPSIFYKTEIKALNKAGVRVEFFGNLQVLPKKTLDVVERTMQETIYNEKLILRIALNYGSKDEIIYGIKEMMQSNRQGIQDYEELQQFFWTKGMPDVDVLIRTSGEQRLSNFLLMQAANARLVFIKAYWPDFEGAMLSAAIEAH
ncbi:di-trans,poly-cis-decaprenylcistransferase [Terribacillus saccharophilus]|uniref:Isoprenyl transferase n=2 Tax=Bacillaceae TaxID=186817 RepID=A0ABX4GYW0_9BACI|nr:di-trans,poly-cis-decaprenylcistransferase [Terribacillus saccharophilus]PAD96488.1 di-trans,poly-cis-decaprenylcistransferase [Terribacillus saccharophilus]PAE00064.1 di-trans,poly-cis-decaprenylcistransferase [Terribacillus saccharophilus]